MSKLARSLLLATVVLSAAACRRGPAPVDPERPDSLPACPAGAPHLVMGLQSLDTDLEQALLRFTEDLAQCRGAVVPSSELGTLTSVGGLSDGTDLVGFAGSYSTGGLLVRLAEGTELDRIEDESAFPISIATLTYDAQPAVAVVWGDRSASDSGERLDVYSEADLSVLGTWDVSYELVRVARPPSGQAARMAGLIGEGLQEYRSDPGATTLATTGELQVARPSNTGSPRSLDVQGDQVRVAVDGGVLSWRAGSSPAFLGPVQCRWPATADTPLPVDTADYVSAVIDPSAPDETLVVVDGELRGGSEDDSHLYRLHSRGECALVLSIPSGYRAISIAWSGR